MRRNSRFWLQHRPSSTRPAVVSSHPPRYNREKGNINILHEATCRHKLLEVREPFYSEDKKLVHDQTFVIVALCKRVLSPVINENIESIYHIPGGSITQFCAVHTLIFTILLHRRS